MRFAVLALSVGIVTYVAGTKPSTNATDSAGTDGGGMNVTDFVENDYDTEGFGDSGDSPMTVDLLGAESENDEPMLLGLDESQSENTISGGAVVYERWSRRGAYDDHFRVNFTNDWVFPASGTNRWTGATVFADGRLRGLLWNAEGEIAMTTNVISAIPGVSTFYYEYTPSNSYRFVWKNFGLNRRAERLVTGAVELFRSGDYAVEYEGEREYFARANPWPGLPVGQSAAEQAATLSAVGTNLENGLYYISANFVSDPEEFVRLVCGTNALVVTNAGEYVFLCEKGAEYEFWTEPFVTNVVWSAFDDVAADDDSPALMSAAGWEYAGCWTTDGGWHWFNVPWMTALGYSLWMPTLRGSPDVDHLYESDFPKLFSAVLSDAPMTNGVVFLWQTSDPNVIIESPDSIATRIDIGTIPDWRELSLSVTATINGRELMSVLDGAYYGYEQAEPAYYTIASLELCDDLGLAIQCDSPVLVNENVSVRVGLSDPCESAEEFASRYSGAIRLESYSVDSDGERAIADASIPIAGSSVQMVSCYEFVVTVAATWLQANELVSNSNDCWNEKTTLDDSSETAGTGGLRSDSDIVDANMPGLLRGRVRGPGNESLALAIPEGVFNLRYLKAAGTAFMVARAGNVTSEKKPVQQQADFVYYSCHGYHASGRLADENHNSYTCDELTQLWGDVKVVVIAGCSVLDIKSYRSDCFDTGPWARRALFGGGNSSPGEIWEAKGAQIYLGYAWRAPTDGKGGSNVTLRFVQNLNSGMDYVAAWGCATDSDESRNACAIDCRTEPHVYWYWREINGTSVWTSVEKGASGW